MIAVLLGGPLGLLRLGAGVVIGAIAMNLIMATYVVPAAERAARQGYVLETRAVAAEAKAAEQARQIAAGQLVTTAYQEQLRNLLVREEQAADETEQRIVDYEKQLAVKGRSCKLDADDLQFLR